MLLRVISGGQTGVDQAAWRAARVAGIPTGGTMLQGFLTEEGPRPDLAAEFEAHELDRPGDPARTEANVRAADGTLWIGDSNSHGGRLMSEWCSRLRKTSVVVMLDGVAIEPSVIARWIVTQNIRILNVAGNRESKAPGIGLLAEAYLAKLFAITQR
jgi:hypothetical protein